MSNNFTITRTVNARTYSDAGTATMTDLQPTTVVFWKTYSYTRQEIIQSIKSWRSEKCKLDLDSHRPEKCFWLGNKKYDDSIERMIKKTHLETSVTAESLMLEEQNYALPREIFGRLILWRPRDLAYFTASKNSMLADQNFLNVYRDELSEIPKNVYALRRNSLDEFYSSSSYYSFALERLVTPENYNEFSYKLKNYIEFSYRPCPIPSPEEAYEDKLCVTYKGRIIWTKL